MRLLIGSANIQKNDVVLEVGCGTGSLTEGLARQAGKVIAVELDTNLAEIAKEQLAKTKNVEILNTDILENKNTISRTTIKAIETAHKKYAGRILLVANLPYNVASPVMLDLVKGPAIADAMYVTVQKEVADRMVAEPGNRNYGILSIYLGATGKVKTIRALKPTAFWPGPQVDSAMVGFARQKEKVNRIKDMSLFSEVVKLFMNHRRKMLKSCIKSAPLLSCPPPRLASADAGAGESKKGGRLAKINWPEIFEKCSIDSTRRPEQLLPQDYVTISNSCC